MGSWATPGVFLGLTLLLGVILAYQPALHAGYIWDDDDLLTDNPCVVGPLGLREIWTTKAADICPLTITTFWAEHKLWLLAPVPYHLVTVLLHAANAILLWRVLLSLQVPGAWLGAALWALHPVQVESVAWISEMKNTLSGVFFLLTILFFLRSRRARELNGGEIRLGAATVLCAALAMASKSSAMVLPVVLCLLSCWQQGRWRWRDLLETVPIFLLSLVAGSLSFWTQRLDHAVGTGKALVRSWPQRFAVAGDAVWWYLGKLAWPHPLMTVYPRWQVNARDWTSFLPLVAVPIVLLVLWRQRRAWGAGWLLAGTYFLVVLFPVLGLAEIGYFRHSFVADHFLYLASMGPLALAGAGLARLLPEFLLANRGWQTTAGAALLLTLGLMSWQRSRVYESQKTLWTDELAKNPQAWVAYGNLGDVLRKEGRLDDAIVQLTEALKLNPAIADNYSNLGNALLDKGQVDAAMGLYRTALKIDPTNAVVHCDLGNIFLERGTSDEAIIQYKTALQIDPKYASVHRNLGLALMQKGQVDDAILQYREAVEIDPRFAPVHENLAFAFMQKGRVDDAIIQYQEALEITPDDASAHHSLGMILARRGRLDQAMSQLQEAIRLKPDYSEARRDLVTLQTASRRAAGVP